MHSWNSGKWNVFAAVVLMMGLLLCVPASAAQNGPEDVMLSWTGDTAATMTAAWWGEEQGTAVMQVVPESQFDRNGFAGALEFPAQCRDISLDQTGLWHYEATAAGLTPATTYCYRVGREGAWSRTARFTTSDPQADNLTFLYMGDIQTNADMEREYALWGALAAAARREAPDLSFAVLGGDIVDSGISAAQFRCFRTNASAVFPDIPVLAANGNHESNFTSGKPELYLDMFAFPENGPEGFREEFYSFDCANCHVLVLNSWIFSGEQAMTEADYEAVARWIRADLAASRADWQIVVTHIPVYAVHSDAVAARVRENWAPIFEQYGVDLVFVGHQHVYSRSYPLLDGAVDYENGVTYIMGNAGQKFYGTADETLAERTVYQTATYQLVRIDGKSLTVQSFDAEGNEVDYCVLAQRERQAGLFEDVPPDAWYSGAVAYAAEQGLFSGVGGGRFAPEGTMTRAMFASVFHRYAGSPEAPGTASFTDVPAGEWYSESVNWAAAEGVLSGTGGGYFSPGGEITLEQMAAVLCRYAGGTAEGEAPGGYGPVSGWAAGAMEWARSAGLFEGVGGTLRAQAPATRAQVAAIMMRFAGLGAGEEGSGT